MAIISKRNKGKANATVELVYFDTDTSDTLAAFEYVHQADMFAKMLSKSRQGAFIVRAFGCSYADAVFVGGKRIEGNHWAKRLKWTADAIEGSN